MASSNLGIAILMRNNLQVSQHKQSGCKTRDKMKRSEELVVPSGLCVSTAEKLASFSGPVGPTEARVGRQLGLKSLISGSTGF